MILFQYQLDNQLNNKAQIMIFNVKITTNIILFRIFLNPLTTLNLFLTLFKNLFALKDREIQHVHVEELLAQFHSDKHIG